MAGAKPERTPTGTERARQEKTCTTPPKTHTKERLEEAGRCTRHQGYTRRSRPPHPKEGKTGDHQYPRGNPPPQRKTAVASPKAREIAVNRRSGPEHAEVPPMKERPAVGVRKPLNNHLERVEEE